MTSLIALIMITATIFIIQFCLKEKKYIYVKKKMYVTFIYIRATRNVTGLQLINFHLFYLYDATLPYIKSYTIHQAHCYYHLSPSLSCPSQLQVGVTISWVGCYCCCILLSSLFGLDFVIVPRLNKLLLLFVFPGGCDSNATALLLLLLLLLLLALLRFILQHNCIQQHK